MIRAGIVKQRLDREFFKAAGRRGGLKGGKARAAKMTPEQRSESARKAVQARWAKVKAKADTERRPPEELPETAITTTDYNHHRGVIVRDAPASEPLD